jgi:hypothetical protein
MVRETELMQIKPNNKANIRPNYWQANIFIIMAK